MGLGRSEVVQVSMQGNGAPSVLEPRFYARADIELDVEVEVGGARLLGKSVNLSEGGLAVRVQGGPPDLGGVVVAFRLPGAVRQIRAEGSVVRAWSVTETERELAVQFELTDEQVAEVRALVAQRAGIAWEPEGSALSREVALRFIPIIRRLARGLAKRLPPQVAVDDLVGAAFVALVELHRAHPSTPADEFERLAVTRLRYAMLDQLRDADPLSRRMRKKAREVERVRAELESKLGGPVTRGQIAEASGTTEAAIAEVEALAATSAAEAWGGAYELEIPDSSAVGPEEQAGRAQAVDQLRTALGALPPRHRQVLELYYGEELTLRQIGNVLGVTEARISQLVTGAVKQLRASVVVE